MKDMDQVMVIAPDGAELILSSIVASRLALRRGQVLDHRMFWKAIVANAKHGIAECEAAKLGAN